MLAFRNLPLESIHGNALRAAEAAECALRQGHFWEMHDSIFQDPKRLDVTALRARAKELGLDPGRFDGCMAGEATRKIRTEMVLANRMGITGTPTFLLGLVQTDGRVRVMTRLSGAQPPEKFEQALEALLARTKTHAGS